jgi:16S rRNA (cytidine1402-2'-O)-methyltransferase
VFFEAPHRIRRTLEDLGTHLGGDRVVAIGRELTKTHEELVIKPILQHLEYFADPKGEFTVLVPAAASPSKGEQTRPPISLLRQELGELTNNDSHTRRQALKVLAERHHMAVNELYRLLGADHGGGQST